MTKKAKMTKVERDSNHQAFISCSTEKKESVKDLRGTLSRSSHQELLDKVTLNNLYWMEGLSTIKIGELYKCTPRNISYRLKKFNIPRRGCGKRTSSICTRCKSKPTCQYKKYLGKNKGWKWASSPFCSNCFRINKRRYDRDLSYKVRGKGTKRRGPQKNVRKYTGNYLREVE